MKQFYLMTLTTILLTSTVCAEDTVPTPQPIESVKQQTTDEIHPATTPTLKETTGDEIPSPAAPILKDTMKDEVSPAVPPQTTDALKIQLTEKYSNSEKNYAIRYPNEWKQNDVPKLDIVLFIPPKVGDKDSYASMNVVSEKVGPEISLNQFYTESTANLSKSLKDVQIEKTGESDLNGTRAKWILYTHEMKNIKFRVLQYFLVADETVYLLTFSSSETTFNQYKQEFEDVANTFHLLSQEQQESKP